MTKDIAQEGSLRPHSEVSRGFRCYRSIRMAPKRRVQAYVLCLSREGDVSRPPKGWVLIPIFLLVVPVTMGPTASATTVLVYLSRDSAVVATDSKANRIGGGTLEVCKIFPVQSKMVFATTGISHFDDPPFDPYEIARTVASRVADPVGSASRYAIEAIGPLQNIWNRIRTAYLELGRANGIMTGVPGFSFIFVGMGDADRIIAAGGNFRERPLSIWLYSTPFVLEPTAESDGYVWAAGVVSALPGYKYIKQLIKEQGAPATLEQLIEKQAKATPNLVGLPVAILTIKRDGNIEWNSRGACSP